MNKVWMAKAGDRMLRRGDEIADFRGRMWQYASCAGGKVQTMGGTGDTASEGREFFPSVFPGLTVLEDERP